MWLEGKLLCTIIPPPCKWVFCIHGGLYGKRKAPTLWKLHGFLCHIMPTGEGITKIGLALVSHLVCSYFSNALILGPYTPLCYPGECVTVCECACWQSSMHVHRNEYAYSKYQRKFFQNSFLNVFMCSSCVTLHAISITHFILIDCSITFWPQREGDTVHAARRQKGCSRQGAKAT